jgi:hypothetical protein
MDSIWSDYTRTERTKLLGLMKKENFEICYPIGNGSYIAPQLLENVRPQYTWDKTDSLKFQYGYKFLPKGVITRLIVRLNEFIADNSHLVWRGGVVFEKDGCRVQVFEEDFPRQVIELEAAGAEFQRKYALSWVRNEIEAIHRKWFPNIQYEKKVPCVCKECKSSDKPFFFDHTILVRFLEKNKREATCGHSVIDVPILELLEGVFVEDEIEEFQRDMREGIEILKRVQSMQTNILLDIQESNAEMQRQLNQVLSRLEQSNASDANLINL